MLAERTAGPPFGDGKPLSMKRGWLTSDRVNRGTSHRRGAKSSSLYRLLGEDQVGWELAQVAHLTEGSSGDQRG